MMAERRGPQIISLILAMLALWLVASAARAQQDHRSQASIEPRGERKAREIKYGDWQKFCFKIPGSNMVCRTTISGVWETGQSAVRIDLIEREGESAARL